MRYEIPCVIYLHICSLEGYVSRKVDYTIITICLAEVSLGEVCFIRNWCMQCKNNIIVTEQKQDIVYYCFYSLNSSHTLLSNNSDKYCQGDTFHCQVNTDEWSHNRFNVLCVIYLHVCSFRSDTTSKRDDRIITICLTEVTLWTACVNRNCNM